MILPQPDTPLYNHPLPKIEHWLQQLGCKQDSEARNCWFVERPSWTAQLWLDTEEITVRYINSGTGGQDIQRSFKYSLSRRDVEEAVFSGP
jgi:hypothetical protein